MMMSFLHKRPYRKKMKRNFEKRNDASRLISIIAYTSYLLLESENN
jgi:hypothetical protein